MKTSDYDDVFHIGLLEGARFDGKEEFPVIERTNSVPNRLIPFDKAVASKDYDQWVQFFIGDKYFLRIWRNPYRYLPILARFKGSLAVDFSVFWNHPRHIHVESIARSRTLGSWMQRSGLDVIPVARWGKKDTYDFAFDGIAPGGTVAVGTLGSVKNPEARKVFTDGVPELVKRVEPKDLVVYGPYREEMLYAALEAGIAMHCFPSDTTLVKGER